MRIGVLAAADNWVFRELERVAADQHQLIPLRFTGLSTHLKGDSKSLSIAAASVVAKVTRDRLMAKLATVCPGYGWETNMGYGTKKHQDAISRLGITAYHRRSFAPIKTAMNSAAV